jgi:hypothetical protein
MSTQPTSPLPSDTQPLSALSALDQYKAYLQDLGNVGTRYTTSNSFFLTILTALLGLLTLMKPSEGLSDLRPMLRILVPLFALMLCWTWRQTMLFYGAMFKVKFDVLRELERHGGLYPVFEREKNLLWPRPWLNKYEHWIPVFLGMPFVVILVSALWGLFRRGA